VLGYNRPYAHPVSSFVNPVVPPEGEPDEGEVISVCFNVNYLPFVLGALSQLLLQTTWKTETPEDTRVTQQRMSGLITQISAGTCAVEMVETPFYDEDGEVDDEQLLELQEWYEPIADWIIAAFLATTLTPLAAIAYKASIPRLRLAFRTGDSGVIVRVLFDGIEHIFDTFNPVDEIKYLEVAANPVLEMSRMSVMDVPEYELYIEHTGEANPLATPIDGKYRLDVVLGDVRPVPCGTCLYRYSDENVLESSTDDGVTWSPMPLTADPRHGDTYRVPSYSGDNAQCNAAATAVRYIQESIDHFLAVVATGSTAIGASSTFLSMFSSVGGIPAVYGIAVGLATLIVDLGVIAVGDALTTDVYEQLICAMYCNMDVDGQLDADGMEQVYNFVNTEIGGIGGLVLNASLNGLGEVGVSNAGAVGGVTDDCSDCDCPDFHCWTVDGNEGHFSEYLTPQPDACGSPISICENMDDGVIRCTASSIFTMPYVTKLGENHWNEGTGATGWLVRVDGSPDDVWRVACSPTEGGSGTTLTNTPNEIVVIPADQPYVLIEIRCSSGSISEFCVKQDV